MFQRFVSRLKRTPIFYRIAIGSAVIIIVSAIIGTLLTYLLAGSSATLWHFIIFLSVGVFASLVINFAVIQLSLQPLRDLRSVVKRIEAGHAEVESLALEDTDPDIQQLALALNSLINQLQKSNQQLKMLSERTITVQEEERKRIARSLHDDTGQSLSTLIINLDRLIQQLPLDNEDIKTRLLLIHGMAAESLGCLRSIIYDLRPAILDDLGLLPAIRWYAQTNLEQAGIQVTLEFPEDLPPLAQPLTVTLFRIVQEGVNNIVRHSHAHHVSIAFGTQGGEVYLHIQDDGDGFNPYQLSDGGQNLRHWGLIGIQERIELIGGRLNIVSSPEHGTSLQVTTPVEVEETQIDG